MPHIVIEATPAFAKSLAFRELFADMHRRIAGEGYALLSDFKSRAHATDAHLAGSDPGGEFVVARLMTTNPRPEPERQAMAQIVHDVLRDAIAALRPSFWWQCCVLTEPFEQSAYIKTDSHRRGRSDAPANGAIRTTTSQEGTPA